MASGAKKGTATDVGVAVAALTDCTPIPRSYVLFLLAAAAAAAAAAAVAAAAAHPSPSFLLMVMSKLLQGGVGNPLHELHSACMCVS
jgi:hypothetical protein